MVQAGACEPEKGQLRGAGTNHWSLAFIVTLETSLKENFGQPFYGIP
jgi:hypothetical protein